MGKLLCDFPLFSKMIYSQYFMIKLKAIKNRREAEKTATKLNEILPGVKENNPWSADREILLKRARKECFYW